MYAWSERCQPHVTNYDHQPYLQSSDLFGSLLQLRGLEGYLDPLRWSVWLLGDTLSAVVAFQPVNLRNNEVRRPPP